MIVDRELNRTHRISQYPSTTPPKKYHLGITLTISGAVKLSRPLYSQVLQLLEDNKELPKNGLINYVFSHLTRKKISEKMKKKYGHIKIFFKKVKRNYDLFKPVFFEEIKAGLLTGTAILRAIVETASSNWLGNPQTDLTTKDLYLIMGKQLSKMTIKRGRRRLMVLGETYAKGHLRQYLHHRFRGWVSGLRYKLLLNKDFSNCSTKQIYNTKKIAFSSNSPCYNPYFSPQGPPNDQNFLEMHYLSQISERESRKVPRYSDNSKDVLVFPSRELLHFSASHPWSAPPFGRAGSKVDNQEEFMKLLNIDASLLPF